jgi:mannose-1-phosphate guanylyltransferase
MDNYYALILAGGGGTRLWPMSRSNTPKQILPLIDQDSMFRMAVKRLEPLFTPEQIFVCAGEQYTEALRADAPEIPAENFIIEPYGRDNAPATGLAVTTIYQRDPEAVIAQLTADHYISKRDEFRAVLEAAYHLAQEGRIVTLGISPSFPSTGFGYIRQGEPLKQINGFKSYVSGGFTEKPNLVRAMEFLTSGHYSWNSGMFIWRASRAMEEFQRQQPEMHRLFTQLQPTIGTPAYDDTLRAIWDQMPKISIDYAIMEGAAQMAVIPIDIGWSDVGSWASLFDVLELDQEGNHFKGNMPERVVIDTRNTLVYSDRLIATIGVEDIIIVDTQDVLLICHKDRSQEVRDVVNHLRSLKKSEYL